MKLVSIMICFLAITFAIPAQAGDEPEQLVLQETVQASFGKAWDAVKQCMTNFGCPKPQTEKIIEPDDPTGFYRGIYVSDFCMIVLGEDSTRDKMEEYGELPRVRGGIWISGRIQYKINVKEEGIRNTKITLKAELSGFEEFITNQIYFWASNGKLEKEMMAKIVATVQQLNTSED
ncbi:MAG: hypothetical protein HQ472_09005 [Ignavibacteria bacterium]|nr:hypothetical protein [Ignavibacteria bacterium]